MNFLYWLFWFLVGALCSFLFLGIVLCFAHFPMVSFLLCLFVFVCYLIFWCLNR